MTYTPNRRGLGLLSEDVGRRMINARADVETVQRLLNNASDRRLIKIAARLAPDGRFGAKTEAAIIAAERALHGQFSHHGIIHKDSDTVRALTQALPLGFSAPLLSLVMLNASDAQIDRFALPLAGVFTRCEINTPLRQAHFLAQIGHESGELRFQEELASGAAYEGRSDLGNTQPGDGRKFKGRGLIQLTGRANYTAFARDMEREDDILAAPTLVATEGDLCVGAAGWFWSTRSLNRFADEDRLRTITRRVNGGYNGLAHRRVLLQRCKSLFGLS